jgi:hypothetical protein
MQNPACTQTDLDKFLTIFEENFRIFQENSSNLNMQFSIQANQVLVKF